MVERRAAANGGEHGNGERSRYQRLGGNSRKAKPLGG